MPYDERNAETGQFVSTYPREAFVDALREIGGEATTQEVRDRVGCAYQTAYARLKELNDEGRLRKRKVGSVNLWSVADDDRDREVPA
jgi:CTP-dependent riboflavin kinase